MKKTSINKVSNKQAKINRQWKALTEYLAEHRANGRCELCGELPNVFGLSGHHVIKRRFNIHTAGNCLILCAICHDHTRYGEGIPISRDEALVLVNQRNKQYGIDGTIIKPPK